MEYLEDFVEGVEKWEGLGEGYSVYFGVFWEKLGFLGGRSIFGLRILGGGFRVGGFWRGFSVIFFFVGGSGA